LPVGCALREVNDSEFVFKFLEQHFDRVTDFGKVLVVFPFVTLDDAFAFVSDVDADFIVIDANDGPLDDFIDFVGLGSLFLDFIHL